MARIRTIKPSFARHEHLQELEEAYSNLRPMLTFCCLWNHCDREGRFEWRPKQLKLDILPFINYDLAASLELLSKHGYIIRYEVAGKQYGYVPTWKQHQCPNMKEPASIIPAPCQDSAIAIQACGEREGEREGELGKGNGVPLKNPLPSAEPKNQIIEMDRHSAATGLGAMVGMSTSGFNFNSLVSAIEQGKRRWPDLRNEEIAERIHDLWKEYVSQPTHVKQSLKNWLDSVGRYIDSDDWKIPQKVEWKPEIDWQGGHVGQDGVYVTKSGQRVPGYKCPPKPKTMAAEA